MEGIKTIKVINDLELEIRGRSVTISGGMFSRRDIGIAAEELPALLAALNAAAKEMEMVTLQAELVAAMERLLACWEAHVTPEELQAQFVENDEAIKQAREILAKAKQ